MALSGSNLALLKGARGNFRNAYKANVIRPDSRLARVMSLGFPSDGAYEDYFYYLASPNPRRTKAGNSRPVGSFTGRGKRTVNHDWREAVEWNENMREDDQIKDLMNKARQAGQKFAFIPQRVFFQLLTGTADADLLPAQPLAGDGSGLFATTDGAGNARFGATNGNLLTVGSMDSGADFRDAIYQGLEQFQLFQDTSGEQLFNDDEIQDQVVMVLYGAHRIQVAQEAFTQKFVAQESRNGGNVAASAGVSNVILDAGWKLMGWSSQKIKDNSIYLIIADRNEEGGKLIYQQVRSALRDDFADRSNSDRARDDGTESLGWKARAGYDINPEPYMGMKIQE